MPYERSSVRWEIAPCHIGETVQRSGLISRRIVSIWLTLLGKNS